MQLSDKQISKIKQIVTLNEELSIARIDVSEKSEDWSQDEIFANIYCVDGDYKIIWQVADSRGPLFPDGDPFCYLKRQENDDIVAVRFSGYKYKINSETGQATCIGFNK